ncbi:MAG: GTP-binding protein [Methanomicrobiales archaeon]
MNKSIKETKIVILGSYNSGKTTTIENLIENKKVTKIEHKGTTVALDYGNIMIDGCKIHLFATPGQKRFKFMRQILARGLKGAILVIDSSKGITETDVEIMGKLDNNYIPYVIFANKQDLNPVEIETGKIKPDVPIIPTVATNSKGIHQGFEMLLELIENQN